MRFSLSATQEYVDAYSFPGHLMSIAIAAIVGLAIGSAVYWYRTRQVSAAFLIEQGLKRNEFIPYYQAIIES